MKNSIFIPIAGLIIYGTLGLLFFVEIPKEFVIPVIIVWFILYGVIMAMAGLLYDKFDK